MAGCVSVVRLPLEPFGLSLASPIPVGPNCIRVGLQKPEHSKALSLLTKEVWLRPPQKWDLYADISAVPYIHLAKPVPANVNSVGRDHATTKFDYEGFYKTELDKKHKDRSYR